MRKQMKKIIHRSYRLTVKAAKKITDFDKVFDENKKLKLEGGEESTFGHPKGHYYSPVHSAHDLKNFTQVSERNRKKFADSIPGFSEKRMINEFNGIKPYFKEFNFPKVDNGKNRFYVNNVSLSLMDSLCIFSVIRRYKPKRIVEIGSGFSSGLMMEINEKYFKNQIDITYIEPYPYLLHQRMRKDDAKRYEVISSGVQEVSLDIFKKLKKDDILFIDSTHVSKFNSDVNYEIFDILPVLAKGVIIHFHDTFDGFEYPLHWLEMGWAWNEDYMLRAFLTNNNEYEIMLLTDYLSHHQPELLTKAYPKNNILNGGSLWMRKV